MSEMQSDNRAIYGGLPHASDTSAKSGPMQERFSNARHPESLTAGGKELTRRGERPSGAACLFVGPGGDRSKSPGHRSGMARVAMR